MKTLLKWLALIILCIPTALTCFIMRTGVEALATNSSQWVVALLICVDGLATFYIGFAISWFIYTKSVSESLNGYEIEGVYELRKPKYVEGCGWCVGVKNNDNLYLRKDLTVRNGTYDGVDSSKCTNTGYWETPKEAYDAMYAYMSGVEK